MRSNTNPYNHYERCTFVALSAFALSVPAYKVEDGHDFLSIRTTAGDNIGYYRSTYTNGPHARNVNAGDRISWYSDHSITYCGWEVCATPQTSSTQCPESEASNSSTSTSTSTPFDYIVPLILVCFCGTCICSQCKNKEKRAEVKTKIRSFSARARVGRWADTAAASTAVARNSAQPAQAMPVAQAQAEVPMAQAVVPQVQAVTMMAATTCVNSVAVDTTGDGVADSIMPVVAASVVPMVPAGAAVDTTGDGRADSIIPMTGAVPGGAVPMVMAQQQPQQQPAGLGGFWNA